MIIGAGSSPAAPLLGKVRDETGDLLTPTHTQRQGRRHRYYVSNRLISGGRDPSGWRLPAAALEAAVARSLLDHLEDQVRRQALMADATAVELATTGSNLLGRLSDLRSRGVARVLAVVAAVRLSPASLTIDLEPAAVAEVLGLEPSRIAPEALTVVTPLALRRRGIETRIVAGPLEPAPDAALLSALRKAHRWAGEIRARVSIRDIAAREKTSESYVARVAHLALLSPAVQRAIVEGKQPADLTLAVLLRTALPLDWRAQEIRLGLAR